MKERWFNYRPLIFVFLFLLLGSLFAFYIDVETVACLIVSLIVVVALIVIVILKRKIKYILIPLVSFIIGICLYSVAVYPFSYDKYADDVPEYVQARVFYKKKPTDNYLSVYADSCIIDGEEVNHNLIIYIYDNDNLYEGIDIGSVISFKVYNFYKNELVYDEIPNTTTYAKDLQYSASCLIQNLTIIKQDKTFAESIKATIYDRLDNGLTNENVELAYSALFGDKAMLGDIQYEAFRLSGVAHLLAVSGLHVGIIVSILVSLCRLCKIKGWKQLAIISVVLLFYMYICDYSVSVVRASIMSLVMLMAKLLFRRYDTMSAIGLSGITCFIINPLSVFDISFLMSFSCVIGIAMLYKPIKYALSHSRAPKWLVDSISISSATMLALTFIMAYFFKNLNLVSILANVIIIPIFTVCFSVFFVLSFLSLILPFVTYLLHLINPILDAITLIANLLGNLSFANFGTMSISCPSLLCFFLFLAVIGRYCVARREKRIFITLPLVALLIIGLVI